MATVADAVDAVLEATVVGSFSRVGYQVRRRLDHWIPLDRLPVDGRVVLITGANSGLGYATARQLAHQGASLHLLVRSAEKGDDTVRRLVAATGNRDVRFGVADLADLDQVRAFAAAVRADRDHLDVLIHNAGATFDQRHETPDGIELTVAVHVVGPFLLTHELLPLLEAGRSPRVVTVSSGGMYTQRLDLAQLQSPGDYRPTVAYARAKRAQVVLTELGARYLADRGVDVQAVHPGWAATPGVARSLPGFNRVMGPLLRTPAQGADTIAWLASVDEPRRHPGSFWHDRRRRRTHKLPWTRAGDQQADQLWDEVARLAGVSCPSSTG